MLTTWREKLEYIFQNNKKYNFLQPIVFHSKHNLYKQRKTNKRDNHLCSWHHNAGVSYLESL